MSIIDIFVGRSHYEFSSTFYKNWAAILDRVVILLTDWFEKFSFDSCEARSHLAGVHVQFLVVLLVNMFFIIKFINQFVTI